VCSSDLPDPGSFEDIQEPYVQVEMITPSEYNGALMELGQNRRGIFKEMKYLTPSRTALIYEVRPSGSLIVQCIQVLQWSILTSCAPLFS
jgi:translation elongation factor EF-4